MDRSPVDEMKQHAPTGDALYVEDDVVRRACLNNAKKMEEFLGAAGKWDSLRHDYLVMLRQTTCRQDALQRDRIDKAPHTARDECSGVPRLRVSQRRCSMERSVRRPFLLRLYCVVHYSKLSDIRPIRHKNSGLQKFGLSGVRTATPT